MSLILQIINSDNTLDNRSNFNTQIKKDIFLAINDSNHNLINKMLDNHMIDSLINICVSYLYPEEIIVQRENYTFSLNSILIVSLFRKETRIDNKLNGITEAYGDYDPKRNLSSLGTKIFNGKKYSILYIAYFENDKLSRLNGPALSDNFGNKHWYLNGKLHREDGPAIMYSDGVNVYYLKGIRLRNKDVKTLIKPTRV